MLSGQKRASPSWERRHRLASPPELAGCPGLLEAWLNRDKMPVCLVGKPSRSGFPCQITAWTSPQ